MAVQVLRRRFSTEEYHRMVQAGILHEDDRVELIEGEIVEMAPIGSYHASRVILLNRLFSQRVGERAIVGVQSPIHLGEHSEPQPDIVLLRPRPDFYANSHPSPEDILLLIEVAVTSLDYDREVKVPLYARAGIGETWLVVPSASHALSEVEGSGQALAGESIEVYRRPGPEGRQVRSVRRGERLAPEALPEVQLLADDILY